MQKLYCWGCYHCGNHWYLHVGKERERTRERERGGEREGERERGRERERERKREGERERESRWECMCVWGGEAVGMREEKRERAGLSDKLWHNFMLIRMQLWPS